MDEQILQRMLQLEKRMNELQTENQMLRQDMNVLRGECFGMNKTKQWKL